MAINFINKGVGAIGDFVKNPATAEAALSTFGGVPGFLGGLYMNAQRRSGEELNKGTDLVTGQLSDLNAFYNKEYYQDFMNTAESRSAQAMLQKQLRDMLQAYNNQGAATGATPEARIAAKSKGQEGFSNALAQMLGLSTQNKANTRRDYMAGSNYLNSQLMNIYNQKAANWQQVAGNVADTGGALLETGLGFIKP